MILKVKMTRWTVSNVIDKRLDNWKSLECL